MATINLKEVNRLNGILSGQIPKPNMYEKKLREMRSFLFFYTVWTIIQNKQPSKLTKDQVKLMLESDPDIDVTICYLKNLEPKIPDFLEGRKIIKKEITGYEALSELIYLKTGTSVPETDLMIPQTQYQSGEWSRSKIPFAERIRNLYSDIDKQKRSDDIKARILKCLQENNSRKRAACLRSCKP